MTGVIMRSLSGFYDVDCQGTIIRCRGRGKLRYQKQKPLVGDRVEITRLNETEGALDTVLPRVNAFDRPAVANIEQLMIVASGAIPVTDPFLIDRLTALAVSRGCEPVILWNKWDLAPVPELSELYERAGFRTIPCSAETGLGLEEIRMTLSGKISAFTGNSGVGKTSLLNLLLPGIDEQLSDRRDPAELARDFPDFLPYLDDCAFVDCAHVKEKGCSLLRAKQEGKIAESRHASYVRLYQQAKEQYRPWENKEK